MTYFRASDVCKESKRQIINAEDVFKALEEIEFAEFVAPLRTSLEGHYFFILNFLIIHLMFLMTCLLPRYSG